MMKPGDEALVLICEPLRMSVRPRSALREFRKISELASFRFVSDPGGTGRRGIADRFRYADFRGLVRLTVE